MKNMWRSIISFICFLLIFWTFTKYMESTNKNLVLDLKKHIPAVKIIGSQSNLSDIIVISGDIKPGYVTGTPKENSLFFKGSEKQIVEHYKNEFDKIDGWQYVGCFVSKLKNKMYRIYYWESKAYIMSISFNITQSEEYDKFGEFHEKNGLRYDIHIQNSTVIKETSQCIKIE